MRILVNSTYNFTVESTTNGAHKPVTVYAIYQANDCGLDPPLFVNIVLHNGLLTDECSMTERLSTHRLLIASESYISRLNQTMLR